jgi:hypothetical protein
VDGERAGRPFATALWVMGCSCGCGNTVRLADGSLDTPYSRTNVSPPTWPATTRELGVHLGVHQNRCGGGCRVHTEH